MTGARTKSSISKHLMLAVLPFVAIVAALFVVGSFGIDILSASRAYVGGESHWSKGQKDAVHFLNRYAVTHQEADFQQYLEAIAVPLGDRVAREELEKPSPDYDAARDGLLAGGNHPDDIPGMIWLFRRFRQFDFFDRCVQIWAEADRHIVELSDAAAKLHRAIADGETDRATLNPILTRIDTINARLTPLEESFSATLGDAARTARVLLQIAAILVTVPLVVGGLALARRMMQRSETLESALRSSEERFDLAVAGSNDGLWDWDVTKNQYYFSPRCRELVGFTESEIQKMSMGFFSLLHPSDQKMTRAAARAHLRTDAPFDVEFRCTCKSGEYRWFRARGRSVRNADGKAIRMAGSVTDITDRKVAEAQLSYQARHDPLTGLTNRREFEHRIELALDGAREQSRHHAVMYLDLDQFKVVNDTCGHAAGDEFLRQISVVLQGKLREGDTLARLGGDEFGILLENCAIEPAQRIAEQLREAVTGFRFVTNSRPFAIGVSIGLVDLSGGTLTLSEVLSAGDSACYLAKEKGRNRVHLYHPKDTELAARQGEMQWVARIQAALNADRFCLYAQEIVGIRGKQDPDRMCELLLRMVEEDGSLTLPMAFIPAAERYNLMPAIDRWVSRHALASIAEQRTRGEASQYQVCIINLSGASVGDERFLEFIRDQFDETGVPPQMVCFEITETVAIANLHKAARFIAELKTMGCRFSLDDFGSGMSSFGYLRHLPVDFLKIDGSFVREMTVDSVNQTMVEVIHRIGHVMGKHTIAEFVENRHTLERLREIGVDYAQGYGIAKPRPFDAAVPALAASESAAAVNP